MNPSKAKVAAATVPPSREDELTKQLRYQQHQIDTLVGQVKNLVSAVKSKRASSRGATTAGTRMSQTTWRGGLRGRGPLRTTPQPRTRDPQVVRGLVPPIGAGSVERWGILKGSAPHKKDQGLFQKGNASTAL